MNHHAPYFNYWGKAKPAAEGDAPYHLLPFHCLDVAAVGVEYLNRSPALSSLLMRELNIDSHSVLAEWITFWLILHDVGKFSEAFQSQRRDLAEALQERRLDGRRFYGLRHDSLGMLFWKEDLSRRAEEEQWFGPDTALYSDGLNWWIRAVTGHHGQPPQSSGNWKDHFHPTYDRSAIAALISDVRSQLLSAAVEGIVSRLDPEKFEDLSRRMSWWIAGLAVLADWVGSNTDFFPYSATPALSLQEYWRKAGRGATIALDKVGMLPVESVGELGFSELFPAITLSSPLQAWAAHVALSAGPQIHLLEDVTGAGKTEAAVFLAHRLMARGVADGFFIGLPTMATANAMYGRIANVYARLFAGDASLVLAQSGNYLVEQFAMSVLPFDSAEYDRKQLDDTASARCTAWLADHNKRALLAPAGVGTIDQALLAVLHSKHQSLRLLGLFRKVLVVDEVHACDAYMQRLLEVLLEFHAFAGGSVILLSATLPQRMRQSLLNAFARGRQQQSAPPALSSQYPLVTSWTGAEPDRLAEQALGTRADVRRTLGIKYVSDEAEVVAAITAALAEGKSVCWIRNTVGDAMDAFELFRHCLPEEKLTLFHARFALHDRLRTEKKILDCFGKDSTPAQRVGRLVIATQVAEQSLDADWDFMVSDLAPIDRLLQRAGRLQRHPRNAHGQRLHEHGASDQRGGPCLWVFGPVCTGTPSATWFKERFPKAAAVYPDHGQLWLTAMLLRVDGITVPDEARDLIEDVFGPEVEVPAGLQSLVNRAEGKVYSDTSIAQQNTIKLVNGYSRQGIDWWNEARTPSRLGEASIDVLLARWQGDELRPWVAHAQERHAWAYSTVRMAVRRIGKTAEPAAAPRRAALEKLLLRLPSQGQWLVVLPLEETPFGWAGQAMMQVGEVFVVRQWCYSDVLGLFEMQAPGDTARLNP